MYTTETPTKLGLYCAYHEHAASPFDQPMLVRVISAGRYFAAEYLGTLGSAMPEAFTHWAPVVPPAKPVDETSKTIETFGN